jgi:hypothetical protein
MNLPFASYCGHIVAYINATRVRIENVTIVT